MPGSVTEVYADSRKRVMPGRGAKNLISRHRYPVDGFPEGVTSVSGLRGKRRPVVVVRLDSQLSGELKGVLDDRMGAIHDGAFNENYRFRNMGSNDDSSVIYRLDRRRRARRGDLTLRFWEEEGSMGVYHPAGAQLADELLKEAQAVPV